jgi:hypothetical protein
MAVVAVAQTLLCANKMGLSDSREWEGFCVLGQAEGKDLRWLVVCMLMLSCRRTMSLGLARSTLQAKHDELASRPSTTTQMPPISRSSRGKKQQPNSNGWGSPCEWIFCLGTRWVRINGDIKCTSCSVPIPSRPTALRAHICCQSRHIAKWYAL